MRASFALSDAIRGSTLVWFDSAHWPVLPAERFDEFDNAAIAFLDVGAVPPEIAAASEALEVRMLVEEEAGRRRKTRCRAPAGPTASCRGSSLDSAASPV